ncbi:MAG: cyclodeaminase/cyclohydrolase family protein [Candidatus Acetothermia bacterium]|jgi:formiminotetrahydrofolate cyclodeaminase|nr:cyclodeaminase/cyclohydrolase family protein [Candidatus Acetothermia bacterium]MDH7505104.1 cyclodeaminase/cyclohydrolase family protein [Candidatus Acetothermia bacterium]
MSRLDQPLGLLLEELASSSPTPGGGAAAALAGALAAALTAMVASLTQGKKGYEAAQPEMERIAREAGALRDRLARLLEEDVAAFEGVVAAHRLPRADPARALSVEEALKRASRVPLETAESCLGVLRLAKIAAARGKKEAVTDAGAAVALAYAGLEAALLNVRVNLLAIQDEAFAAEHSERAEALATAGSRLKGEALKLVQERMEG